MFRILFLLFIVPALSYASLSIGVGKVDITPAVGTPSAGYTNRKGEGMKGVHDPLFAISLFIDNGERQIALCSVDHLGFTYEMVQEITDEVHLEEGLEQCEVYIGSSHTHSGGGAYLNIPILGESLAGIYSEELMRSYVKGAAEAITLSGKNKEPGKIGIGYGKAKELSEYRGVFPVGVRPLSKVSVIKATKLDGTPIAVLFNYPLHPTVLNGDNRLFSADFVGYARDQITALIGSGVQPVYFNGAQAEIIPLIFNEEDRFDSSKQLGKSLAKTVEEIWKEIDASEVLDIKTEKESYSFKPQATPFGLILPVDCYQTEMNLIVLNKTHAFITIPGELSTLYDRQIQKIGKDIGYKYVSILGLTNDAHGYILLPESWSHKTYESGLSFGGESYGKEIEKRAEALLKSNAP
jgi:hypothetical protein